MEKIIEVKNLIKNYGQLQAVKDISFYVEKGKLFSFLGPNGAGKSTTINIICTLLDYDTGDILIDGHQLGVNNTEIHQQIGVVFQDNFLDDLLTVKENLSIRAGFYYKEKAAIQEAIKRVTEITDLADFLTRPYGKLSGGQRRRADIARALIHNPKILILDEPTTGLDPKTRKSVWQMIEQLKREHEMTIFLTTHYMEEAANSDYIVVINQGEIVATGTPLTLKAQYTTDSLYLTFNKQSLIVLDELLTQRGLTYTKTDERFIIPLDDTMLALEILTAAKPYIKGFEVISGSMDDVFLNIIGQEINV